MACKKHGGWGGGEKLSLAGGVNSIRLGEVDSMEHGEI